MTEPTREVVNGLSGRKLGAAKSAAKKCGCTLEDWIALRESGQRHCYRCRRWIAQDKFQKDQSRSGGLASICKECISIAATASRYRIDRDHVVKLRESACEICGRFGKMEIDHDHVTGDVRGVLCSACNNAIGLFQDSTEVLKAAIAYLNK